MKTRREFLVRVPFLALAGVLAPTALAAPAKLKALRARRATLPISLDELDCATFAPLTNSFFKLKVNELQSRNLILAEVQEQPITSTSEGAKLETFSLTFWDASTVKVPQGTYRLQHSAIGEFAVFIVPVAQAEHGQYYEAVFNRLWQ